MTSENLRKWEERLRLVLDKLDDYLEDKYSGLYPLHPVRPTRGKTANKSHDGLFNITAKFTLGLGSEVGEGYSIELRVATLKKVDAQFYEMLEAESLKFLNRELAVEFNNSVHASKDGNSIKIHGDLSLD